MKDALLVHSFVWCVLGLAMVFGSQYLGLLVGTLSLYFGVLVIFLGIGLALLYLWEIGKSAKQTLEKIQEDKSGIAWILAVGAMTIILWPFVYWVIGMPYLSVETFTGNMVQLTGFLALVNQFQQIMIAALPAFIILVVLIWSVVQSKVQSTEG